MKAGTNFKLLKACTFCRNRKLKCLISNNSHKCTNCIVRKQECVFDHKVVRPGTRRQRKNSKPQGISTSGTVTPHVEYIDKNLQDKPSTSDDIFDTGVTKGNSLYKNNSENCNKDDNSKIENLTFNNEEIFGTNTNAFISTFLKENFSLLTVVSQKDPNILEKSLSPDEYAIPLPINQKMEGEMESLSYNIYKIHIEPYTPFVLHEMFKSSESRELDHFSKFCIQVACLSSPTNQIPPSTTDLLLDVLKGYIENDTIYIFDDITLSFFLLLPLRIKLSDSIVQKYLRMFNNYYESKGNSLSINLLVAALSVDAYYTLLRGDWNLKTNVSILIAVSGFVETLNNNSFNYHFLSMACLIYKLIMIVSNKQISYEDQRLQMLHLEYEMLLWPAKLSRDLSIVEDDLLATPEAFFLHILHNTLLTEFYSNAIKNKNTFGKMNSIFAVPGLYQFIAGMAKSNFRLNEGLVGRWSIIANCQLHTAKQLLQLNEIMEFEEFILSLMWYKKSANILDVELQGQIHSQIQKLQKSNNSFKLKIPDKDGAKVFWLFRDIRSMSLQSFIDETK